MKTPEGSQVYQGSLVEKAALKYVWAKKKKYIYSKCRVWEDNTMPLMLQNPEQHYQHRLMNKKHYLQPLCPSHEYMDFSQQNKAVALTPESLYTHTLM